ncbi:Gfo/Idh/MocA family protein [Kushneria indalinina]|uniref:Putative dehydrogenase n=1 Tax=Kushneria indalinina DSM 14324 TaxID=1122140 RepID=A0A3D9DXG7_9GAMM|nr:Gfo/Idh/MocA family oxidoreductase [Kushneria indalinina]REC95466.1 putative dehydrogenase [Kushneria indalinina DSM 14324]
MSEQDHHHVDRDEEATFSINRRRFLQGSSGALLAAGALGPAFAHAAASGEGSARSGGRQASNGQTFDFGNGATAPEGISSVPASATGRPMPTLDQYDPVAPDERLGWAVVGLGDFALNQILPAFANSTHSRLAGLVSGNADKARQIAQQYGVAESGIYSYDNFDEISDNDDIDIVYIILPNALHEEFTVRGAQAGKHVLCEKPMAPTVEACQRMIEACRDNDRKLMIAYREQFEPHNLAAIKAIREGMVGDVNLLSVNAGVSLDPEAPSAQWRLNKALAGGGSLYDIGIYALNASRYLLGEEPTQVFARIHSREDDPRFAQVEDNVAFQLIFPNGAVANCTSSYSTPKNNEASVFGTKAWLRMAPLSNYYNHWLIVDDGNQRIEPSIQEISQFAAEMDHLSRCVQDDTAPHASGEEGMQDVRIIRAIYESAATGEMVSIESDYERDPNLLIADSPNLPDVWQQSDS